ncbi:hypothetical protein COV93_05455 [Candidatus Woesearchaeota archaeon CG11_big_fil_rev_8_21_14_0_20_43_8]|nr:MAG: hypothetical protein COV93_05455 [Candidatus Woesearchaeota archaeon CG11_big_fil_rev_8_21_14_0_20_43_8]PIO08778.1 MAG: hypothetical protein COT47_01115 [Candidatus Woesearchaeota archaeon CG08_land_8_20_14_0_20_43_7]
MVEFNPDGSLKLPNRLIKKQEIDEKRMRSARCIKIRKDVVDYNSPKKCRLKIVLSEAITDFRFIPTIYSYFANRAEVPTVMRKTGPREFEVEIGTAFKRCTDCCSLVNRYREHLDGCLIEDKGTCTFQGMNFGWNGE